MTVFSDSLRRRANELGLSHAEVARRAGLSERRYGNYVGGLREPDLQTLSRIAVALETSPDGLLAFNNEAFKGPMRAALLERLSSAAAGISDHELEVCVVQMEAVRRKFGM